MVEVVLKIREASLGALGEESAKCREIQARRGEILREALLRNDCKLYRGIADQFNCRGLGICGSCMIKVREGDGWREKRACQIQCFRPMEIELE